MGFLAGKRFLITGVLSNRSIAYGIARACHREGAELAFSYAGRALQATASPNSPPNSARPWCSTATSPTTPRSRRLFADLGAAWPKFDGFVHSIGFAPREAIAGDFLDGLSREAFRIAHDISRLQLPGHGQGRPAPPDARSPRCSR